jgi:hypothetical protein
VDRAVGTSLFITVVPPYHAVMRSLRGPFDQVTAMRVCYQLFCYQHVVQRRYSAIENVLACILESHPHLTSCHLLPLHTHTFFIAVDDDSTWHANHSSNSYMVMINAAILVGVEHNRWIAKICTLLWGCWPL